MLLLNFLSGRCLNCTTTSSGERLLQGNWWPLSILRRGRLSTEFKGFDAAYIENACCMLRLRGDRNHGAIVCEKLPVEVCAFSVSSSGARCVLEKFILSKGNVQYECQTSQVIAEKMNELIETEGCVNACGVEKMTVGMSTDNLAEPDFTKKLCSPSCYSNCPNIIDLYFNLAAGEGTYMPRLCEAHRSRDRRMMSEMKITAKSFALAPAINGFGA